MESGIIITAILILIPVLFAAFLIIKHATNTLKLYNNRKKTKTAQTLVDDLKAGNNPELKVQFDHRKKAGDFHLDRLPGSAHSVDVFPGTAGGGPG